jgi:hypothetical protein
MEESHDQFGSCEEASGARKCLCGAPIILINWGKAPLDMRERRRRVGAVQQGSRQ